MKRWLGRASQLIAVMVLILSATVAAQPTKTADDYYREGDTAYNVGEFEKAIEAFKKAYELETDDAKKPTYHYNMAQAYRQLHQCDKAAFFYKRVLAAKEHDTKKPLSPERKKEIEDRVAEMEACAASTDCAVNPNAPSCKSQPAECKKGEPCWCEEHPDDASCKPAPPPCDPDTDEDCPTEPVTPPTPTEGPSLLVLDAGAGATKMFTGGVTVPVRFSFVLSAGYPIKLGDKAHLVAGAGFQYTPVDYGVTGGGSGTAKLSSLYLAGSLAYEVAPKLAIRGDLGLGALFFSGLVEGNPFTLGGAEPTGALSMFELRLGVSAEYALTKAIALWATPMTFQYSPAKEGLRDDISSLSGLDFMAGLGYRM